MKTIYDPRLQEEIPAWVITHIAEVSAWMKKRGHKQWSIGGVGPNAFDALEAGGSDRTKRYVQGVGWCWMEDGEVIEVISEAT